jgi:two-component sensor histidine kinase
LVGKVVSRIFDAPRRMRLVRLDLVSGRSGWRRFAAELLAAFAALTFLVGTHWLFDLWRPGIVPYALAFPGILIGTLMGRLRGGLLSWIVTFLYLWKFAIPHGPGFRFINPVYFPQTVLNLAVGLIMVLLTESARAAAASILAERERRVAERDMLLAEFDHRNKNNLAILSSLISMQARDSEDPAVIEALTKAAKRIASLGRTYAHLRYEPDTIMAIDVGQLLDSLCAALRESLIEGGPVSLNHRSCPCMIERDRASALALLINELITNAIKHAFVGQSQGKVDVHLEVSGDEGLLTVSDDGIGIPAESPQGRQGMRLLNALARMAQADLFASTGAQGTRFELRLRGILGAQSAQTGESAA